MSTKDIAALNEATAKYTAARIKVHDLTLQGAPDDIKAQAACELMAARDAFWAAGGSAREQLKVLKAAMPARLKS